MRNRYKMETSKDFTAWDLNCRWIIHHTKSHNQLEKVFKRKYRRKYKKFLEKYLTTDQLDAII